MLLLALPQVSPSKSKRIIRRLKYICLESTALRLVLLHNKGMALEGSSTAQSTVTLDETESTKRETQSNAKADTNSNEPYASARYADVDVVVSDKNSHDEDEDTQANAHSLFGSSSTSSLLIRMTKPDKQDIREWMGQTQKIVDTEVTNWQHMLLRNTAHVSTLLDQLAKFLTCVDGHVYSLYKAGNNNPNSPSPPSSFLLAAKFPNNNGAFESAINVYLHVITLVINQLRNSLDSDKHCSKQLRHYSIQLLRDFSLVAEDALKFFRTHDKYLLPIRSRVLEMRNEFFLSLRPLINNPSVGILPLENVSLEKIHMAEDAKWLTKLEVYSNPPVQSNYYPHLKIRVSSRDCVIEAQEGDCEASADETTTVEKLELAKLLLKQLSISFSISKTECEDSQYLSNLCTRLAKKFDIFLRSIDTETRKCRLKSDTCCSVLKHSLCHLEVKFHQVERILEEIPEHIRRVIGVADYCTRQLVVGLGHTPQTLANEDDCDIELAVPPEWATSIEEVSKEFFKPRLTFMSCFPILWKLVAKILGGSGNQSRKKLKDFWEQVRSELEDFQKEVKVKEMDANYSITLTVPVFQDEGETINMRTAKIRNIQAMNEGYDAMDEERVPRSRTKQLEFKKDNPHETEELVESHANYDNTMQLSFQLTTTHFATNTIQNKQ
ncbi:unnamed protein product [Orchesella dallaii]|uniref:Uncharacterized protein n=1 Tax=Orchesella dallaii TaxID=48710 RepID=A0ABP1Q7X4_9HEXA